MRRWLVVILLAALLLRVAAIVATGPATLRFGDAQDYVDAAASLCEQGRYPDRGSMPFFRAPGASQEGHGLGLSLTRRAIEAMGGQVWAQAPAQGGAELCVRLKGALLPAPARARESAPLSHA